MLDLGNITLTQSAAGTLIGDEGSVRTELTRLALSTQQDDVVLDM